jgi:hypothetical protein
MAIIWAYYMHHAIEYWLHQVIDITCHFAGREVEYGGHEGPLIKEILLPGFRDSG